LPIVTVGGSISNRPPAPSRGGVDDPLEDNALTRRDLDEPAVAALGAAARGDLAEERRAVVAPDDDGAAVPLVQGIRLDDAAGENTVVAAVIGRPSRRPCRPPPRYTSPPPNAPDASMSARRDGHRGP
jgi:hypothetical protein